MFGSYFTTAHQFVLGAGVGSILFACWLWWRQDQRWALVLLTVGALILRLFSATLDPFLNQWDECFHALVAKHMVADPCTPRLFVEGVLPTTGGWTQAGIWLHKPPFFLWLISASLAIFGLEPWAVRLPSALLLTALVPVTFRMGDILVGKQAGWIAALFTACSYYLMELTAGAVTTDHNDAMFIATVAFSWWALLELWEFGGRGWAAVAGLFAAFAVLTKMYVGAMVFAPWVIAATLRNEKRSWWQFLIGAGIAFGISAIWFGSIALRFPQELFAQLAFDTGHLGEVVEGHAGDASFHFLAIDQLMAPFTWWLVLPAYGFLVWRVKRMEHRLFLLVLLLLTHGLFAWADTKMPSFTMALFPLYVVALAFALVSMTETLIVDRFRSWALLVVPIVLAGYFLNIEVLQHRHTLASPPKIHQQWRQQQLEAIPVLNQLESMISDPTKSVVYHVPALHHIQFMFATGIEATDQLPAAADAERLLAQGYTVYVVQDGAPVDQLPPGVVVIRDEVLKFPDIGRPN